MLPLLFFVFLSVFLLFLPDLLHEHHDESKVSKKLMIRKSLSNISTKNILKISSDALTKFKDVVQPDFRVFFLWMQGLIVWVIGFYSWIFKINEFYLIGTLLSVLFCSLSIYIKSSTIKTDFDWL